jgi:pSer/pThr/pTyr-binding forkhead associated (FHA) protein
MAKRVVITFMSGAEDGRGAMPRGMVISLGREEHSDVVVPYDSRVSRRHAQIELDGDQLRLSDLGSRNGTYLEDGSCITSATAVAPGTLFRLGRTWLKVDLGD